MSNALLDRVAAFEWDAAKIDVAAPSRFAWPDVKDEETVSPYFEGLKLRREPTEIEKLINFKAIQDAFDSGEEKLLTALLSLRDKLIEQSATALAGMDPDQYHTLILEASASDRQEIQDVLQEIYERSRELLVSELEAQGATDLTAGAITDAAIEDLGSLAGTTISRLINDVQARAAGAASRLAVGASDASVEESVTSALEDGSTAYVDAIAAGADHSAFSDGRSDEAADQSDIITSVYYSALLDDSTCEFCEKADGETGATEDDVTAAPNPDCLGQDRCRCVLVYVFGSG